jgi:hypothetical protein
VAAAADSTTEKNTRTIASRPRLFVAAEHQRQPRFRVAHDDDLGIRAGRQLLGRLDALPLEELRADALRDDSLEVGDALRFDALPLRFLLLLLQPARRLNSVKISAAIFSRAAEYSAFASYDAVTSRIADRNCGSTIVPT